MSLLPKVRLLLARRPWLYWLCTAVCAAIAWAAVGSAQGAAVRERQRWGTTRAVWVTTQPASPGGPLTAERREYPLAVVPGDALTTLPAAATAAHPLARGEVLVAADLAGAVAIPSGWVAFAITGDEVPHLVPGDAAALFGQGARWCDGVVLAVLDTHVEVAVPPECADGLSAVLAVGEVVLARAVDA